MTARARADRLGTLTDTARAGKLVAAQQAAAKAAKLLAELYDDRSDQAYRMTWAEQQEHRAIASAATDAERALRAVDAVVIARASA